MRRVSSLRQIFACVYADCRIVDKEGHDIVMTNLQTYSGKQVWRGPDMVEGSHWAHTFTSHEIKTLKEAADSVIDREIVSLGVADFDLRELDAILEKIPLASIGPFVRVLVYPSHRIPLVIYSVM